MQDADCMEGQANGNYTRSSGYSTADGPPWTAKAGRVEERVEITSHRTA